MLIKKSEEPFFHRFLSIAKEIIKKNGEYRAVLFGDIQKLYLACGEYAACFEYDTDVIGSELYEFKKVPYELSELPNGDFMLSQAKSMNCQESYLIAIKQFFKAADLYSTKSTSTNKADSYKICKIAETTGCWLCEDDSKILDKFKKADIYSCDIGLKERFEGDANNWNKNYIIAHDSFDTDNGLTRMAMAVYFNVMHDPRNDVYDQQSMELKATNEVDESYSEEEQLDSLISEKVEEEEENDEFDPMLV